MTDATDYNKTQTPENEAIGWAVWEKQLPRIDELRAKLDGPYMTVEPRSSLALDDPYLGAYRGGGLHRSAMGAALDALMAARQLVKSGELPMTALYPVLRAAIENASLAIHLLCPESRDVRLKRSYVAMADGHDKQASFLVSIGEVDDAATRKAARMAELVALIELRPSLGDPAALLRQKDTHTSIVTLADASIAADPATTDRPIIPLVAMWQLLSGLSHAKTWAMLAALDRDQAVVHPDGQGAEVRMTSSSIIPALALMRGVGALETALRCYGQRSRTHTAQPEDASEPH